MTGHIVYLARRLAPDNSTTVITECLVCCGSSISMTEDYGPFLGLLHELVDEFRVDEDLVLTESTYALGEAFSNEISEIEYNSKDPATMEQWLEEYVDQAKEYGVDAYIGDAVSKINQKIKEAWNYGPDEETLRSLKSEAAFEDDASESDGVDDGLSGAPFEDSIDALFDQLR